MATPGAPSSERLRRAVAQALGSAAERERVLRARAPGLLLPAAGAAVEPGPPGVPPSADTRTSRGGAGTGEDGEGDGEGDGVPTVEQILADAGLSLLRGGRARRNSARGGGGGGALPEL